MAWPAAVPLCVAQRRGCRLPCLGLDSFVAGHDSRQVLLQLLPSVTDMYDRLLHAVHGFLGDAIVVSDT